MILTLAPFHTAIVTPPRPVAARVLLVGWFAFWLLALVQPLCDAWAGELHAPADGPSVHAAASADSAAASPGHGHHPDDLCCYSISAATLDDARTTAVAPPGTVKIWAAPPRIVAIAFTPAPPRAFLWAAATPPPSDDLPLYLRTLRLRI